MPGVTLQGSYASHDTEQKTHATLGKGEIVIRDEKKQHEIEKDGNTQELASINRDVTKAQEITKDERAGVKVYASTAAIKAIETTLEKTPSSAGDPRRYSRRARSDANKYPEYRNACDISDRLAALGGGTPRREDSPRRNPVYLPNGMVVTFDYNRDLMDRVRI